MPKTPASHRERPRLLRCIMLLVALAAAGPGVVADATAFDEPDPTVEHNIAILDDNALEALASPIALYPDELLAIVLPAATFPLQIVQAARFLEAQRSDPGLEPDANWDDSVVALLNYPEVLAVLDSDLAWTARLGDAVIAQEATLMRAITRFRERAYNAGNLRSDERQHVSRGPQAIAINAASTDTVYVPYYNPSAVIVPQTTRVYHYYSQPYPLYYYPYAPRHPFLSRSFWGLTSVYALGWATHGIRIYRHDHYAHPYFRNRYYGPRYRDRRSSWPRHAPNARHDHRRHAAGEVWRHGRIDRLHAERRRHSSDRIRNSHKRAGTGNSFRANNGLLGNGALARPRIQAEPRELRRADRGLAARGASARPRDNAVTVKPPATPRQPDATKRTAPLRMRAQANNKQRRDARPRESPAARGNAAAAPRSRSVERHNRRASPARGDRIVSRGDSTRATVAPRAGGTTRTFRGNAAGSRTRAGGAFLGNGYGSQPRR